MPTDLERRYYLLAEKVLEAWQADLEHGVHWINNEASQEFAKKYPALCEALNQLSDINEDVREQFEDIDVEPADRYNEGPPYDAATATGMYDHD